MLNFCASTITLLSFHFLVLVEYAGILSSGLDVLDGTITSEGLAEIAGRCSATSEEIEVAVKAAGGLIWEFVKSNSLSSLSPVLQQVGFEESLAEAFGKVCVCYTWSACTAILNATVTFVYACLNVYLYVYCYSN
jgi:hypothetical protein